MTVVDSHQHYIRCNAICPGTIETPSPGERVAALSGEPHAAWRA